MKQLKLIMVALCLLVVGGNVALTVHDGRQDRTAPVLTVPQETLELSIAAEDADYLSGVKATDDRDGDISGQVVVEHISQLIGSGVVKVTYAVFDQAGNAATATRTVQYTDYTGPRFHLSKALCYGLGETVTLMDRLTATDDLDGDITDKIRLTSMSLSNELEGVYPLTVQVTNDLGDTSVLTLSVVISKRTPKTPEITLKDYLVYLDKDAEFEPKDYLKKVEDPASESRASTRDVEISGEVDTAVPGTYTVSYTYDGEAEEGQTILTVVVQETAEDKD